MKYKTKVIVVGAILALLVNKQRKKRARRIMGRTSDTRM